MLRQDGRKEPAGVTAIETALMMIILVPLVFGIVEFGLLFYDKAMITNASREGARAGIVYQFDPDSERRHPGNEVITDTINDYLENRLVTFGSAVGPTVTISRNPVNGDAPGDRLIVDVLYRYDFLVLPNFVAGLVGGLDLTARTIMRLE
ncbi:MAG: TadE/TadG family type IV pilus assembly protein [bacterium]